MGSGFREQIISRRLGYSARVTQRVMAPGSFRIIDAGLRDMPFKLKGESRAGGISLCRHVG